MDPHENITLIRKYIEDRWNQRKLWLIDELVAPSFVIHTPIGDIDLPTLKDGITSYLQSFPDSSVDLEDILAHGDKVAIRYSFTGTHSGDFMGVKATGKKTLCTGMAFYRIANRRIVEGWFVEDTLGLLQQLRVGR
jgi:hypothetical protein